MNTGILEQILTPLTQVKSEIIYLALIIVVGAYVLNKLTQLRKRSSKSTGLSEHAATVSVDGSQCLPVRHYLSEMQGLAGKPDAIISENGFIIPVERKPLARKIRDRYVAQLLVYMRLVEEFEGKRPPYGYLILGANCRKIKIENSEGRQAWLQSILDQMHAILKGAQAKPQPHARKCAKCDVQAHCQHSLASTPAGENPPK